MLIVDIDCLYGGCARLTSPHKNYMNFLWQTKSSVCQIQMDPCLYHKIHAQNCLLTDLNSDPYTEIMFRGFIFCVILISVRPIVMYALSPIPTQS